MSVEYIWKRMDWEFGVVFVYSLEERKDRVIVLYVVNNSQSILYKQTLHNSNAHRSIWKSISNLQTTEVVTMGSSISDLDSPGSSPNSAVQGCPSRRL